MKVQVAAVQPLSSTGDDEHANAWRAVRFVEEAAARGCRLIMFPEGYPGPYTGPLDAGGRLPAPPTEMLREAAARNRIFVSCGSLVPGSLPDTFRLRHSLIGPDGEVAAQYHRMQPNHPIFNAYLMGGRMHIVPGDEFKLVPTEIGHIGLLICSELFVPELSRTLMLMGADIILAPGGGVHGPTRSRSGETWRCVARARAAENLVYVLANQNVFRTDQRGRTCIAGPEEMLAEVDEGEGVAYATLDLDRLAEIRGRYMDEEMLSPPAEGGAIFRCRPGQCHDRRPELYGKLIEPQPDAFDYHYYRRGPESYREEYARIRGVRPSTRPIRAAGDSRTGP